MQFERPRSFTGREQGGNAEAALVIALARADGEGVRAAARRAADWSKVGVLAARHQVEALCFWSWRNLFGQGPCAGGLSLPSEVARRWKNVYAVNRLDSQILAQELTSIQETLDSRGVKVLALKGPWVALAAYPDPGTRTVGDFDLCIRESDYRGAVEALRAIDYSPVDPLPRTSAEALDQAHYGGQIRLVARRRRLVELHFRLCNAGPPSEDEHWVWETARDLTLPRTIIRVPGPEAMLLHLLLHANQHRFAMLRLLHDIRWALERDGGRLSGDLLLSRVRALRCEASVHHALLLARDLAGASAPADILEQTRPSLARRWIFSAAWRLESVRRLAAMRGPQETELPMLYLLEMGSLRDKARYLRRLVRHAGGLTRFLSRAAGSLLGRRGIS